MTRQIRSPFPWFGGKGNPKIKNAILAALPPHTKYVEPFGGGASVLGAGHLNYPIKRDRLWILGFNPLYDGKGYESEQQSGRDCQIPIWSEEKLSGLQSADSDRLLADGLICRTPDGVANRLERLGAIGNGQVPDVAALAWRVLTGTL